MMTASPAASLLDEYLESTVVAQQQAAGQQSGISTHVPARTVFLHGQVMQGLHNALDGVMASHGATEGDAGTVAVQQQQRSSRAAPADATAQASNKQHQTADKGLAAASAATAAGSSRRSSSGTGLFRAMRQADAAALYAGRLAAERDAAPNAPGMQDQLQVVSAAREDGVNSSMRLMVEQAALSSKLQKLQQDMEVRSYRQGLMQQLRDPGALFSQPTALQQQQHEPLLRCSSTHSWAVPHLGAAAAAAGRPPAVVPCRRPSTSPAVPGSRQGGSMQPSSGHRLSASWDALDAGTLAAAHSAMPAADASEAPLLTVAAAQLQHLRALVECELPWRPQQAAAQHATAGSSSSRPDVPNYFSSLQPRPRSSHATLGGHHGPEPRLFQPQPHPQRRDVQQQQQQHQKQQQPGQQQLLRPASSVAALEQSLSELTRLRAKFMQQQHAGQQQQHEQEAAPRQLKSSAGAAAGGHTNHTWLPDTAQHGGPAADAAAVALPWQQHTVAATAGAQQRQSWDASCSASSDLRGVVRESHLRPRYGLWDSWQQEVHADRHAAQLFIGAGAAASKTQQLPDALRRSMSVPRMAQRVWDLFPPPSTAAAAAHAWGHNASSSLRRSISPPARRALSPVRTVGAGPPHMQQQQPWAAASRPRPLGPHNTPGPATAAQLRAAAGQGKAAAATAGGSGGSLSAWLVSSPLKRAQQQAAAGWQQGAGSAAAGGVHSSSRLGSGSWLPARDTHPAPADGSQQRASAAVAAARDWLAAGGRGVAAATAHGGSASAPTSPRSKVAVRQGPAPAAGLRSRAEDLRQLLTRTHGVSILR
jgi:hypothetical protein